MGRVPQVQSVKALIGRRPLAPGVRSAFAAILGIWLLTGCVSTHATRQVTYAPVTLAQPKGEIAESDLLAIRIKPFESDAIPEQTKGLSKQIRKAEGYYSAVQLKKALQASGYWGPVRVVPADITGGEVTVSGRILESDGEILRLAVRVRDATGAVWSESQYEEVVDIKHYGDSAHDGEVFKFLYMRIANDVARSREKLARKDIDSIRQVAELKFAEDFAPDAFKGYLEKPDGTKDGNALTRFLSTAKNDTVKVVRLPANDDPTLASIRRVRITEEGLVDTFDLQHEDLSRRVGEPYTQWRTSRLKEMNAVRTLESKRNEAVGKAVAIGVVGVLLGVAVGAVGGRGCYACASAGGSIAGAATGAAVQLALHASKQAADESEIHRTALEELGESVSQDLKVTVVQVEGEALQLKGTADEQFKQWRTVLKQIHEREVGAAQAKK